MTLPWKTKPTGRDLSLASACVRVAYPDRGPRVGTQAATFYILAAGLRQQAGGFGEEQRALLQRVFARDWGLAVETDDKARLARECWKAIQAHL